MKRAVRLLRSASRLPRLLLVVAALASAAVASMPRHARAAETDDIFAGAAKALAEGRPADAIAGFEALADRGVVDPSVSFDRALAYAQRVRLGAGQPGDLGQAAHGFEEARALTGDATIEAEASRALTVVRGEVARKKARAGEPVDLDKGEPLGTSIVRIASEDAWAAAALAASMVLGLALFLRALVASRRVRIGATVTLAMAAPAMIVLASLTAAARSERLHLREAVVISVGARLSDERGIALAGGATLPEGARVRLLDARTGLARVLWGATDAWVQASSVRPLARLE